MDTIKVEDLKSRYPKTWEEIVKHGFKYYAGSKHIKISSFLHSRGYHFSLIESTATNKWIPYINYDGPLYGVDDRKFQFRDFEPLSLAKAKEKGVIYALSDYEDHFYLRQRFTSPD